MKIIGCDLHARQQTIAMLDSDTGELEEKTLEHQGETVREFYSALSGPILVGIGSRFATKCSDSTMSPILGEDRLWPDLRRQEITDENHYLTDGNLETRREQRWE